MFIATTLNIGVIVNSVTLRRKLDLAGMCFAVAFGLIGLGLIGLLVWLSPVAKTWIAAALIVLANGAAIHLHRSHGLAWIIEDHEVRFALLLWVGLSVVLLAAAQIPLSKPAVLQDGPYAYKNWTLPVRIQKLTGDLPADNALPAFVAEYMARGTSFAKVRPIMPGQEVSNRPFYQALIYLPFRVLFGSTQPAPDPYPTYTYVGTLWPDTSVLISDRSFARYLAIAIPCNATMVLGLAALLAWLRVPYSRLAVVVFGVFSPYLIMHTIFTWPKNLAGFYIVCALLVWSTRLSPVWSGLFVGLAYLAHPYAIAFVGAFALALVVEVVRSAFKPTFPATLGMALRPSTALMTLGVMMATTAIWPLWTTVVLRIPSDLLAQNIGATTSISAVLWPRIANFAHVVFPVTLAGPFNPDVFARQYVTHLASAVGILPLLFLPWALAKSATTHPLPVVWLGLLPAAIIVCVFGQIGMVPMLHGWQAVWPAFLALTLAVMAQGLSPQWVLLAVSLQAGLNITILGLHVSGLI
jgi:hypothetical protein